jgi:hypothetical protein
MTYELSKAEKISIIDSHRKNLAYNKYNLEMSKIQEEAKDSPSAVSLEDLNSKIDEISDQLAALDLEAAEVNTLTE